MPTETELHWCYEGSLYTYSVQIAKIVYYCNVTTYKGHAHTQLR